MQKRRGDATKDLRLLARYFRQEMREREWGRHAFEKLLKETVAAGEKVDSAEREAVRRVLAMIDRTISLRVGALSAVEVLAEGTGGPIPLPVIRDVVAALQDQAGLAVADALAALLASVRPGFGGNRGALAAQAARLAALRPTVADLKASLRAIDAISPRRKGKLGAFPRALKDALAAAMFASRAVQQVGDLLSAERAARVGRRPLVDLTMFLARAADFGEKLVTLRLATASGKG